jgi:hypothetical protein
VICIVKDGEAVTEMDEMTDSTRTEVFEQLTKRHVSAATLTVGDAQTEGHGVDLALDDNCCSLTIEDVDGLVVLGLFDGNDPALVVLLRDIVSPCLSTQDAKDVR